MVFYVENVLPLLPAEIKGGSWEFREWWKIRPGSRKLAKYNPWSEKKLLPGPGISNSTKFFREIGVMLSGIWEFQTYHSGNSGINPPISGLNMSHLWFSYICLLTEQLFSDLFLCLMPDYSFSSSMCLFWGKNCYMKIRVNKLQDFVLHWNENGKSWVK